MSELFRVAEAGAQKARVLDVGSGDAVVVLHGWGGRIESMRPVISCLDASFRVVAIDLPGFGESPVPRGVWGTPDYAEFVHDLLSSVGVESAHFVGHSFGAKTSLYLAATHPSMVRKLVLQGSSGLRSAPRPGVRVKRAASRAAKPLGALGPPGRRIRRAVFARVASQDYREAGALRPILVKVVNEDLGHLLGRISASTLLIWGGRDDAAPLEHGRIMERLIPDAGLVVFEEAGHFAYLDEPARFCRIVRHFLDAPAR